MFEGKPLDRLRDHMEWRHTLPACGAAALGALIWAHAVGAGAGAGTDFTSYLTAAHDAARGLDPYRALVTQVRNARPGDVGIHPHGYVYPPLLCVLLALPLRLHASAVMIWALWQAVNVAAVLWMGFELSAALRGRRDWRGALLFAGACLVPAVATYDLWLGQTDLLMAALGVGACGLWLRGSRWAPLPLAVAIAIKPTMALLLIVWLWKGDWRAALRGALASVALLLAPFALVGGAGALGDYAAFYLHWSAFNADAEFINQAPTGMLLRLFSVNPYTQPLMSAPWLVAPLRWLVAAGAVGCWLWAERRERRRRDPATGMLECLLALPLILLLSPLAEDIHFCLLIPALVGFCFVTAAWGLWRQPAAWALWAVLALSCVPRMQELIYPSHLLVLPGQMDPALGPLVALARSGMLLYLAILTLLAGAVVVRHGSRAGASEADLAAAPLGNTAPLRQQVSVTVGGRWNVLCDREPGAESWRLRVKLVGPMMSDEGAARVSGPLDDALAQARARLDAIKARRSTVQAELTELRAASGTKKARAAARVRDLEAREELLEEEMAAAHAALGRAILDQFVRDLAQVRIPQGDPDVARELMVMANNLRRACLAVLADWPELREEAERRLAPMPEGPTTLHG